MTIETALQTLVQRFATFDGTENCYLPTLNNENLLKLDFEFNQVISSFLLGDEPEKKNTEENYRQLISLFTASNKSSEINWLEENLSESLCRKIVRECYEKLTSPYKFKVIDFNNIYNLNDLEIWLEDLKNNACSYHGQAFCTSLIQLLKESSNFYDDTSRIKPSALRTLVNFMPMALSSYGALLFAKELFALYALYFVLLKGGQFLENSSPAQQIGTALKELGLVASISTSTLLVRLLEMTFWSARMCLVTSMSLGSAILNPVLENSPQLLVEGGELQNKLGWDLILARQNIDREIKTVELQIISEPLVNYLAKNREQHLRCFRAGSVKGEDVKKFLFKLRSLDLTDISLGDKFKSVRGDILILRTVATTNTGTCKVAIDLTEKIVEFLAKKEVSLNEHNTSRPLLLKS